LMRDITHKLATWHATKSPDLAIIVYTKNSDRVRTLRRMRIIKNYYDFYGIDGLQMMINICSASSDYFFDAPSSFVMTNLCTFSVAVSWQYD